jgi:hypothetical protein
LDFAKAIGSSAKNLVGLIINTALQRGAHRTPEGGTAKAVWKLSSRLATSYSSVLMKTCSSDVAEENTGHHEQRKK